LEDFIAVATAGHHLIPEIETAASALKTYIADAVRTLLGESLLLDGLPGYLLPDDASRARIGQLLAKLRRLEKIL
jgi:hypothetical protein